ncbi:MAG: helix-turn-helix domain-containing protein, partial [Candidatus Hodarchaeota archaeon]
MEKSDLTQILMNAFYLNESQAEIYGLLLIKEILTIGEISLSIKKSQEECNKIVKDLSNLKLIKTLPGTVVRYKALPPFEGFFAQIKRYQKLFDDLNEEISINSDKLIKDFKKNIKNHM